MGTFVTFGPKARTKSDLLSTVKKEIEGSRIIARSTLKIAYADGSSAVRYQDTDVVTFHRDGGFTLDSGGFRTSTTKSRMNEHAPCGVHIWQAKGLWTVSRITETERTSAPYYDGMTFDSDGVLVSGERTPDMTETRKMLKKIRAFVALVDTFDTLPLPCSGDCFGCQFGDGMGHDHLLGHFEEKYLTGALIVNAMREKGYSDRAISLHFQMNCTTTVKRALTDYLKKRLLPDLAR